MSLFITTETEPTQTEKLQRIVNDIKQMSSDIYNGLVRNQKRGIDVVWNNEEFTPREIIDALGPDAINIFSFHGKMTDLLVDVSATDGIAYSPATPAKPFSVVKGKIVVEV